jgi:hypothetical protein
MPRRFDDNAIGHQRPIPMSYDQRIELVVGQLVQAEAPHRRPNVATFEPLAG